MNIPLILSTGIILDIFIENSLFEMIFLTKNYAFVSVNVENIILLKNTHFHRIIGSYIFDHDYCRNRSYDNITFKNSDSCFIKCFSINFPFLYHYIKLIFINIAFENLIITGNNSNIIFSNIYYLTDMIDCAFVNIFINNVTFVTIEGNIIYIYHCSYGWFADIYVKNIQNAFYAIKVFLENINPLDFYSKFLFKRNH